MGDSKGSIWYLKKNAEINQCKVYKKSLEKF